MDKECKDTFEDIVSVWPFAKGEIAYQLPYNVRLRTLQLHHLGLTDGGTLSALTADRPYYTIGEDYQSDNSVELEERKSILKSSTKYSESGRRFDVSLTLQVVHNSRLSLSLMDHIESDPSDFLVLIASGEYLLVRTDELTYRCKSEEQFGNTYTQKLTITASCYNGIQRIEV